MKIEEWDRQALERGLDKADQPIMVEFYTQQCPFCKSLEKILEQFATEAADRAVFAKIDLGKEPSLAERYRIRSVPTVIVFDRGEPSARQVGAVSRRALAELLDGADVDRQDTRG